MDADKKLIVEHLENGVVKLILNNPPLNLNSMELTRQLEQALSDLASDDSVRAVVLTGTGEKAFCAGSDVKEFPGILDDFVGKKLKRENKVFDSIENLNKPVIAAIEGIACGGGCEIAMACDIRIAAENSKLAFPEINLGVFPGSGGLFRLYKLVGPSRAMELMYTGKFISAHEAEQIGLINRVVPAGESVKAALSLAEEIANKPAEGIKAIKRGVRESMYLPHEEALLLNYELTDHVFKTEDCAEGVRAFFEKRPPKFKK
jgi:enoyl-CoA hydratase